MMPSYSRLSNLQEKNAGGLPVFPRPTGGSKRCQTGDSAGEGEEWWGADPNGYRQRNFPSEYKPLRPLPFPPLLHISQIASLGSTVSSTSGVWAKPGRKRI